MSCQKSQVPDDGNVELMRKAARGHREAFACLYGRFGPKLKRLLAGGGISSPLREDLVQNIFTDLWERRKEYRTQASFEAYLFAIARNALRNELRRACRVAGIDLESRSEYSGDPHHGLSQPEAELHIKELAAAVEEARAKLTEMQRQALDAATAADIPSSKVLEELGCSYGAFRKRLQRARKRMRELLAPLLEDENDPDKT